MKEREFISWIRSQTQLDARRVPVGPGDDCAVVAFGDQRVIVTTDQVLDGVHFKLHEHGPRAAGRKAMARNLSDIAAMAATATAAVATVALPPDFGETAAKELYAGLREIGDKFNCPVVGGDVGAWDAPLAITVTIMGSIGETEPILRSGARVGDAICVTGSLGGAWKGDKHLTFTPRIAEAQQLAKGYNLNAMIDISDGLATDLAHICKASGLAAEITAADIPVLNDAADGLQAALTDGEDYELLFTLPLTDAARLIEAQPLGVKVSLIGKCVEGEGIVLIHPNGRRQDIADAGWEHET